MPSVESLQAEVGAIRVALANGEIERVPQMLLDHDAHLQTYCRTADVKAVEEELRKLHAMQLAAIQQMRDIQRSIAGQMRSLRQSGHAVRAYAQAGRIP